MLITEKIQNTKKSITDLTEKIGKIKRNSKGLRQIFLKFNYPQAISKQLTVLIEC